MFDAIWGQAPAIETLTRALDANKVHHAYRFEGPDGVGKEKAAFALAQALVCERAGARACGECSACQRAVTLAEDEPRVPQHPDVVLVQRGLYPQNIIGASEATGISVEQIRRVVLGRSGFPPHEGRALVFIVKDAHELTIQAANSLLKTLEEPGDKSHFILLTSRPNRLLDTIRSRTLAVRFGPLADDVIARILREHGADDSVAPLAQGSASLALDMSEPERMKSREEFLTAAQAALAAPDLATAIDLAKDRKETRDVLRESLAFFAQHLAMEARDRIATAPEEAERAAQRHALVLTTIAEVERNVQPTLALEAMVTRLRRV